MRPDVDKYMIQLLDRELSNALEPTNCDWWLEKGIPTDREGRTHFLEPFARIQDIRNDYIDDFLHMLCYFYPGFIGDNFKRYLSAPQKQCGEYLKAKSAL